MSATLIADVEASAVDKDDLKVTGDGKAFFCSTACP